MEEMFDLEDYVRKRLAEIDDLEERKYAKEVLLEGLLPVFRLTEQRYQNLEERIKREIEVADEKYAVRMIVIEKKDYDAINTTLFPVCPECMEDHVRYLYFMGNHEQRKKFEKQRIWNAVDKDGGVHQVEIRKAECYRNAVKRLYETFVYNKVRWTTVHTGYMDRFYEVCPMEEETENLWELQISFEGQEDLIKEEMLILWNVEEFTFQCMKFMVPCMDGKYYEHELDTGKRNQEDGYMAGINEDILSVRHEKDKIILLSQKESFRSWSAYQFHHQLDLNSSGYHGKVLHNKKKSSFAENFTYRQRHPFTSRTELMRELESFPLEDEIELKGCEVADTINGRFFPADMNPFLREETFRDDTRKILILYFKRKNKDSIDTEDMVRFAVSQIQMMLFEYRCVGVLDELHMGNSAYGEKTGISRE